MSNPDRLPIRDSQPQPDKRHHSGRYYAQRVGGSFTTSLTKVVCGIILLIFLVASIVLFILWLSLRPHRPRFYMIDFTVPGLDQPLGLDNDQITFNVTARNSNQHIGIRYDSMVGSVFYQGQQIGSKPLLHPLFQEPKTTTILNGTFDTATSTISSHWWQEFMNDRQHGTVFFRLRITSVTRFRILTYDSRHHKMHVNCDVAVGSDGLILPESKNKRCDVYFS